MLAASLALFAALILASGTGAMAHSQSYGYLDIATANRSVAGSLALAVRDLDTLFDLDQNGDGKITWGEIRSRESDIATSALEKLAVGTPSENCALAGQPFLTEPRGGENYIIIPFGGTCPAMNGKIRISYGLMFDVDAQHRGLVALTTPSGTQNFVLTPDSATIALDAGGAGWVSEFLTFTSHGVHHIWTGYDHILFLITLLLGTAVQARESRVRPALIEAAKVVTAFTLSHTLTLGLAASEILRIPVAVSESLIAATIVLAAVNNIWPLLSRRIWLIALVFGLIHGVGFANVLADMELARRNLLVSLLAFNLGVEIGQLAIVLAAFPLILLAVRFTRTRGATAAANLAVSLIGTLWFVNRAFGMGLLGL
jgi:hypothetical protein